VAARYDGSANNGDMIREVVDTACMTNYGEPFYRAHNQPESNLHLWQAGLNRVTPDLTCFQHSINTHATRFVHTRTSLAINNWDVIDGSGTPYFHSDWQSAYDFVLAARTQLGRRLSLQNNSLGEADGCRHVAPANQTPAGSYWCYLDSITNPKGFQTENWKNLGYSIDNMMSAINEGDLMGANFIELPDRGGTGGWDTATSSQKATLQQWDATLSSNWQ
jgi:hypothetical protein